MTAAAQHVLTASKSRPRQMHILARALTDRYEVRFAAVYQESRREWALDWWDGPTEDEVRGILTRLAAGLPAVTSLRLRRGSTDLAELTALLMWIDADPERLSRVSTWNIREAFESARYPERAPEAWRARAQRLLDLPYDAVTWLRARTWDQVLAELDT